MGRKIPAKKHRGVKDPLVQQAKRLESLKGKINAPPSDPDEQPVPHSLTRLFAFQDTTAKKKTAHKKKSSQHNNKDSNTAVRGNPISRLRKLPGESGRSFSLRINSAVKALHNPMEDSHYPQDFEAEDVRGERMADLRERRARRRRGKTGGGGGAGAGGAGEGERASRTHRLAAKKQAKKLKELETQQERREVQYERVSFGDVSHAPPALPPPRRAQQHAPRPGRRELLLTSLLAGTAGSRAAPQPVTADVRRRERARQDAVDAYRALKAAKYKKK